MKETKKIDANRGMTPNKSQRRPGAQKPSPVKRVPRQAPRGR